jgi:hypothetical protein
VINDELKKRSKNLEILDKELTSATQELSEKNKEIDCLKKE